MSASQHGAPRLVSTRPVGRLSAFLLRSNARFAEVLTYREPLWCGCRLQDSRLADCGGRSYGATIVGVDGCVFCEILAARLPASVVLRNGRCTAFMDIQPVNAGHVLVVPEVHAAHLADLPEDTGAHMFRTAQRIAVALYESGLDCEGVNLLLADGEAAGQEVFHVHLHVFPRFDGDGFGLRFGPGYANSTGRDELEEAARRIREAL
jgi:histidine triad (HIT) family protein